MGGIDETDLNAPGSDSGGRLKVQPSGRSAGKAAQSSAMPAIRTVQDNVPELQAAG